MKLERWLYEWGTFILILMLGLLAGIITYLAGLPGPCSAHAGAGPGRAHLAGICREPGP